MLIVSIVVFHMRGRSVLPPLLKEKRAIRKSCSFFVYSQKPVENISLMENTKRISVHFDNTDIILVDPCYFIKDEYIGLG